MDQIWTNIAKLINKLIDMEQTDANRFTAAIGFFVTMYSITQLEHKLKAFVASISFINIIIFLFIIGVLVYLAIEINLIDYLKK